jgi:VWFA-related protein
VQGFGDDPAVLAAALGFGKGKAGELSAAVPNAAANLATSNLLAMMGNTGASTPASAPPSGNTPPSAAPNAPPPNNTNAPQGMTDALVQFIQTNTDAQSDYSEYMTLDAFQSLAKFLGAFPGRKNLIWLSGSFPFSFQATPTGQGGNINSVSNVRFDKALKDTIKLLSAARVAVYPTDAHGVATNSNYTAGNALAPALSGPSTIAGPDGNLNNNRITEDMNQNISYANMDQIAESTGGKAIKSTNDLAGAISDAATSSDNFYTLSYSPSNLRLDDTYRPIEVKIASGKYNLTYRRGYYATNSSLPGAAASELQDDADKQTMERLSKTDPLLPFMKMGMPQVEQILYKALILPAPPLPALPDAAPKAKNTHRYTVQFAVDLKDLKLTLDAAGVHSTTLNLSMILFDKYGKVVTRKDHIVALNIKPSVYAAFQQNGVQLHDSIEAPDNNGYWLRTGVYDQNSHKVGTMEVNLAAVHPLETATVAAPAQK